MSLKKTALDIVNRIPEQYKPAAVGATGLAGLLVVFGAANAIFNDEDNTARIETPPSTQSTSVSENTDNQERTANPYLVGISLDFLAVSDLETCEKAATAMREYGDSITDPQFSGLTIYANCMQTGPEEYSLILQNGRD